MATIGYENSPPTDDTGSIRESWYYIQKVHVARNGPLQNIRAYMAGPNGVHTKIALVYAKIYNAAGTVLLAQSPDYAALEAKQPWDWHTWNFPDLALTADTIYRFTLLCGNLFNDSSTYRPRVGLWDNGEVLIMDADSSPSGIYSAGWEFLYGNYAPGPGIYVEGIIPGKLEQIKWEDVVEFEGES